MSSRTVRTLAILLLAACRAPIDAAPDDTARTPPPPNLLVLVADDVGRDAVSTYGVHRYAASTPTLDRLARDGVTFRRAWAAPLCSPSRAMLLTGRYPTRTGVGDAVHPYEGEAGLPTAEITLAEALRDAPTPYATAAVGKWHLGHVDGGLADPLRHGFEHFRGTPGNLGDTDPERYQTHDDWVLEVDGDPRPQTRWADSVVVDNALELATTLPEPWLVYVSFYGAHGPYQAPPPHLDPYDVPAGAPIPVTYRAMVRAQDLEIGRLLDGLGDERLARTVVLYVGDNGTPAVAVLPPFDADDAKQKVYEGGVGVPFVARGPGVGQGTSEALVSLTDVLPTLLDLAGADLPPALDGVSLAHHLEDPSGAGPRDVVFTERFSPNGVGARRAYVSRAIRDDRYKLVWKIGRGMELYDLAGRATEGPDLLAAGSLDAGAQAAFDRLKAALRAQTEAFGESW